MANSRPSFSSISSDLNGRSWEKRTLTMSDSGSGATALYPMLLEKPVSRGQEKIFAGRRNKPIDDTGNAGKYAMSQPKVIEID